MAAILSVALSACGKKGPPRPPIRIEPTSVQNLTLRQIGPDVIASFALRSPGEEAGPPSGSTRVRLMRMLSGDSLNPSRVSAR